MPPTLNESFSRANGLVDSTKHNAEQYASLFTANSTREQVMRVHQWCQQTILGLTEVQVTPGIDAYAQEQWPPGSPNFTDTTDAIIGAADEVVGWLETNFPTVRSTLNAAMAALSIPGGQQDALRAQMGDNLNYVLTHQIQAGQIVSPVLTSAQLAPLVSLLNTLAAAATMP